MRHKIVEQVQEGQHEANKIVHQIRNVINQLPPIALETFKDELKSEIKKLLTP